MAYSTGSTMPSPNPSLRSGQMSAGQRSSLSGSYRGGVGRGASLSDVRMMEASHIIDILRKEIVQLTGGRDRQGGPILTFPSHAGKPPFTPEDITACLKYLSLIPSEESRDCGFSVVVDSLDGSWTNLVTLLGCLKQVLGDRLKQVFVVRSQSSHDRRSSGSSFRRDHHGSNIEPQFVSLHRLQSYLDKNQLTGQFGGLLDYDHSIWLQNRLDLERYVREVRAAMGHLDSSETQMQRAYSTSHLPSSPLETLRQHRHFQDAIMAIPTKVIREGKDLLFRLQEDSGTGFQDNGLITLDTLEAQKQVKRMVQDLENRCDRLQDYLQNEDRSLSASLDLEDLQRNMRRVVDWILGPGEKLLSSQVDIGDTFESADSLRKRHEELEIKCTDTYGQYAELRHTAEDLMDRGDTVRKTVEPQRDYMDTVCRSFASRLERRRTLLITSVRFHRLAEDFSQKLDSLLEILCTDIMLEDVESAANAVQQLQETCEAIDESAQQTLSEGQSLLDEMSRPIKNAMGMDITPDYAKQIKHVNKQLEDLQERKMRCDELADVRKLKLQQLLQLRTCERDADQAVNWIMELCDVMTYTHTNMGRNQQEAEFLQAEHRKFELTAAGTYDYGKQLLQAGIVLRRSLRYDLIPNNQIAYSLEEAWKLFSQGTNERSNRLTVAIMFFTSSERVLEQVDKLLGILAQTVSVEITVEDALSTYSPLKERTLKDYQETTQMGKTLLERLTQPAILTPQTEGTSVDDQGASETINSKLKKLDRKISELDFHWLEMHRSGLPPDINPRLLSQQQRQIPDRNRTRSNLENLPNSQVPKSGRTRKNRRWTSEVGDKSSQIPYKSGSFQSRTDLPIKKGAKIHARSRSHQSENGILNHTQTDHPQSERHQRQPQSEQEMSRPFLNRYDDPQDVGDPTYSNIPYPMHHNGDYMDSTPDTEQVYRAHLVKPVSASPSFAEPVLISSSLTKPVSDNLKDYEHPSRQGQVSSFMSEPIQKPQTAQTIMSTSEPDTSHVYSARLRSAQKPLSVQERIKSIETKSVDSQPRVDTRKEKIPLYENTSQFERIAPVKARVVQVVRPGHYRGRDRLKEQLEELEYDDRSIDITLRNVMSCQCDQFYLDNIKMCFMLL
ncbi:hypothetical protein ScPMuIL_016959 [Solemya velum]